MRFLSDSALWERFHRGDVDRSEQAESPLVRSWLRSRELGAGIVRSESGVAHAELIERRERFFDLVGGEDWFRQQLRMLDPELQRDELVLVVADSAGVIISARGGGAFAETALATKLVDGARWDEPTRGTNGIGTALVEARPVSVLGAAHFDPTNHSLACHGTPIQDPHGEIVGAVNVTSRVGVADRFARMVALSFASALERAATLREYVSSSAGGLRVVEKMLQRASPPALLVESPGIVRQTNAAARRFFGIGANVPALRDLLGLEWSTLQRAAMAGRTALVATRRGELELELEPILDSRKRVLSVVVFASPRVKTFSHLPSTPPPAVGAAFAPILGSDPAIIAAKEVAARFAPTPLPVMILAETGTGKELFARAIHEASPRARGPFVAINCGALAEGLLESELFGYARGAFTGAHAQGTEGKLAAARGGTLFLDEIAEMPEAMQAALLRVLEDGSYYRIGDSQLRRAEVRIVCATGDDLPALVRAGRFRKDLYYRVNAVCLRIPSLRSRNDRVELSNALLARFAQEQGVDPPSLSDDAIAWIESHEWPGNIRELRTALQYAMVLARNGRIELSHLPVDRPSGAELPPASAPVSRRDAEREALEAALAAAPGNLSEVARRLGVARTTLYRMMRRYGLKV